MLEPDVVGVRLDGELNTGVTATDLVLTITEMLRNAKVVGKFVEFLARAHALCLFRTGRPSATWRRNTARQWDFSRPMKKRWPTIAPPAETKKSCT